jgi:hypothetical protein
MATFLIETGSNINIDSLGGKVGGDTYDIRGGYLTVDQHTRYGVSQNTSACFGNITMSAVSGGTIEFNSTLVRLVPFSGGSGVVPNVGTTISQGSASGKLIGVYTGLTSAPLSSGATMGATGYTLIRQWNSVSYTAAAAFTGITATTAGVDRAGWLEIVGVDLSACTVNRLNTFKVRGDWYDFQGMTTDGVRTSTYQIPSNGTLVYVAGVWVETGTASEQYEFYPCAGSLTALSANTASDSVRGKVCYISTAGVVRFGSDGTNSTGGYCPPSGRRLRIPNIFFMNCTGAARTVNVLPNATLATRYDFITTGGGNIDIDKAMLAWYPSFAQPYSVTLSNVGILTQLLVSEIAAPITWTNVGVGQEAANTQIALSMATCFAGGVMSGCTWSRAAQAGSGAYVQSLTDLDGFTIINERNFSFVKAANATTGSATLTRVANSSWTNSLFGGGRIFMTTCTNVTHTNTAYYDNPFRTTASAIPMYIFDIGTNCYNITFDGVSFSGLTLVQPYNGILQIGSAGCSNIKLRNLGTFSSPLDLGGTRLDGIAWTRVTTTATVTSPNHGLTTSGIIYVIVSSSAGAISVATKTVTVTNTNTFTFTCTNGGDAAGTISYYPTMSANLFVLATGAAANTVKIQRCYTPHTRTNLYTADNSSKNIILENVYGDFINVPVTPQLNGYLKGVGATPSMAVQTSCYGTHWFDVFTTNPPTGTTSVAWTRTGTLFSATTTNHGMRGTDLINVGTSSDRAAIVLGQKTIGAVNANIITGTCLNAGATSGTLSFSALTGRIGLLMNESTTDTSNQYTIISGTPAFTSAGGLGMQDLNDEIIFETPEYIIGHTYFPVAEPVMAGGTIGNYNITYAIDKNNTSGYTSFKNYAYRVVGGGGSSGSINVTMASTSGVSVNDYIFGTNIAPNAKITGITNSTTVVVDIPNIGTVSGILRFTQLPSETNINAENGFKLKIDIKTISANTTAISSLYCFTNSTSISRAYQYPLDPIEVSFTLDTLKPNSEVRIYRTIDDIEIAGVEDSSTAFTYTYTYIGSDTSVYIRIHNLQYEWLTYENIILSNVDQTIPIQQQVDRNYLNP